MGLRFSKATIKSGFLVVQPAWYKVQVTKISSKRTKADDANNWFVTFEVIGTQKGEDLEKMLNVPVTMMYCDKETAAFSSLNLWTAANGGKELDPDVEYEFPQLQDLVLEGYIKRGERDGSPINIIPEFAPLGTNFKE